MVPLGAELEDGAAEQVELDGHLGARGRIGDADQLVSREDLVRIVDKVEHGDEVIVTHGLQPLQGELAFILQGNVVAG